MMVRIRGLVTISILSIVIYPQASYAQKKTVRTVTIEQTPPDVEHEPTITIWIHGTTILNRKEYKASINNYKGLKLINRLTPLEPLLSAFTHIDTDNPDSMHKMYSFLWSGKLSFKSRLKASVVLYHQLMHIVEGYMNTYNVYPKIRIITHSHGGNVALNLARIYSRVGVKITIDKLILLACPVQRETAYYLEHSMFRSVYALYSKLDFIQVIDPQGFYDGNIFHIFSKRRFDWNQKLMQAEVRVNNKRLTHNAFQKVPFLTMVPAIVADLDQWNGAGQNTSETRLRLCVASKNATA